MAGLQLLLIESKLSNNVISNVITILGRNIRESFIIFVHVLYVCMHVYT